MLPRETGFFQGPKPILLSETKIDDVAVMIIGSDKKHSQIEFGAHQVFVTLFIAFWLVYLIELTTKNAMPCVRVFDDPLGYPVLTSRVAVSKHHS